MPTTTLAKSTDIPIPRGSISPAGGEFRGPAVAVGLGGTMLGWISNGSAAPTAAGYMEVFASAKADGTMPAVPAVGTAIPGTDWYSIGIMTGASIAPNDTKALTSLAVRAEHQYIFARIIGNVGNPVTGDGRFARIDSANSA
ncbi:MAG: hypothetical protein PGN26_14550 [Xylophilus ampelinus]